MGSDVADVLTAMAAVSAVSQAARAALEPRTHAVTQYRLPVMVEFKAKLTDTTQLIGSGRMRCSHSWLYVLELHATHQHAHTAQSRCIKRPYTHSMCVKPLVGLCGPCGPYGLLVGAVG